MRKLLVSLFTIVIFLAYAFGQRINGHSSAALRVPNTKLGQPNSAPPSAQPPTGSGSSNSNPAPGDGGGPAAGSGGGGGGSNSSTASYHNGTYTGSPVDTQWGPVQVRVSISSSKISDVQFLEYPQDRRRSVAINDQAVPILQQEAIQAQSAQVDVISGATLTSEGFVASLQSALGQANA